MMELEREDIVGISEIDGRDAILETYCKKQKKIRLSRLIISNTSLPSLI